MDSVGSAMRSRSVGRSGTEEPGVAPATGVAAAAVVAAAVAGIVVDTAAGWTALVVQPGSLVGQAFL